ncbi:MAG: hypothetical protein LYZ66_04290 [Nitrososphaerales archaeon]|nr:hypothetical protein [Nitrososphaerales archaeon]
MSVHRFQVMALLQAARAFVLGLPLDSAFSWGLNRSIFYAAAKRGFKGGSGARRASGGAGRGSSKGDSTYFLGDEMAFKKEKGGRLYFTIGGEVQTEDDFKRQIESRFQDSFKQAWTEAVEYVRGFDRGTLESGTAFFSQVYRPKRDEFAERWTETGESAARSKTAAGQKRIR